MFSQVCLAEPRLLCGSERLEGNKRDKENKDNNDRKRNTNILSRAGNRGSTKVRFVDSLAERYPATIRQEKFRYPVAIRPSDFVFFQTFPSRSVFENAHRCALSVPDRQPRNCKTDNMASDVLRKTNGLPLLWRRLGPALGRSPNRKSSISVQLFAEMAF